MPACIWHCDCNIVLCAVHPVQVLCSFGLYYPERLHQAFILNAPAWFNVPWKMISSFLDANTRWLYCACRYDALEQFTAAGLAVLDGV